MLYRRKQRLLFPWNWSCLLRRRQQGSIKFKIIQLSLVTVTAVTLITYLSGFHMKDSFYHHEPRSRLIKALNLGSTFRRFDDKPSSGSGAPSLSNVLPTLEWTSGLLKSKPSSAQPAIHPDFKPWKTTPQHKTTLITKTVCARHYPLLILVSSAPANFERRYLIRQTWVPITTLFLSGRHTFSLVRQGIKHIQIYSKKKIASMAT